MTKIYIAQLKCPNNHCVVAAAGPAHNEEQAARIGDKVMAQFEELVLGGKVKYECAICLSKTLRMDVQPTRFRTMEEARIPLAEMELQQALTAMMLRGSKN